MIDESAAARVAGRLHFVTVCRLHVLPTPTAYDDWRSRVYSGCCFSLCSLHSAVKRRRVLNLPLLAALPCAQCRLHSFTFCVRTVFSFLMECKFFRSVLWRICHFSLHLLLLLMHSLKEGNSAKFTNIPFTCYLLYLIALFQKIPKRRKLLSQISKNTLSLK